MLDFELRSPNSLNILTKSNDFSGWREILSAENYHDNFFSLRWSIATSNLLEVNLRDPTECDCQLMAWHSQVGKPQAMCFLVETFFLASNGPDSKLCDEQQERVQNRWAHHRYFKSSQEAVSFGGLSLSTARWKVYGGSCKECSQHFAM